MKKNIIYIFICFCFSDNFLPEDNADVNYTQIFFMWPQIENAENYELTLISDSGNQIILNSASNSLITNESLSPQS